MVTKAEREQRGINQEFEVNINRPLHKIDNQQGPTVQHGNYTQYFIINCKGRESENIYTYQYIYITHCAAHLKLTQYCILTTLQFLKKYKEKNRIMHSKVKYESISYSRDSLNINFLEPSIIPPLP